MRGRAIATLTLALLAMGGIVPAQQNEAKPEDAAQTAAESWLKLLDAGDYDATWNQAAKAFKDGVAAEKWKKDATASLVPLGTFLSRKLKSSKHVEELPGAPKGKYVILEYDTAFEKKPETVETVFPMVDPDGVWRVSGYFVRPAR